MMGEMGEMGMVLVKICRDTMCYATLFMCLFFGVLSLDLSSNLSPNHIDADLMIKQFITTV